MISDGKLQALAEELAGTSGVVAVALGGSRARGTHRTDSGVDLGIYGAADIDRKALAHVASRWSRSEVTVGAPGSWGPWVDSGAWLTVDGTAVDLILRDIGRVTEQCERARRGEFSFYSQPGHPFGFLDIAYAGEVATGVPFVDGQGVHAALKKSITPYPDALRRSFLASLWQVDFHLDGATKAARSNDTAYVALCMSHAVILLSHAWHGACGEWVINEKGVVAGVSRLPNAPSSFSADASATLAAVGTSPGELKAAIERVRSLPRPA